MVKRDLFLKSLISALRVVPRPLRHTACAPRLAGFARLEPGLLTKASLRATFDEFSSRACVILLFVLLAAPGSGFGQVRQAPQGLDIQRQPDRPAPKTQLHPQQLHQQPSGEQASAGPHDARVVPAPSPWEYATPDDADILEGWESMPTEGVAGRLAAEEYVLTDMAQGWRLFTQRRYDDAARHFTAALSSPDPDEALSARLGLAYTLIRQGKPHLAIPHLEALTSRNYRPSETRPALVRLLFQAGRWDEAAVLAAGLPPAQRLAWHQRLLEARLLRDYRALPAEAGPAALSAFITRHSEALSGCRRPDIFHGIALRLRETGRREPYVALSRRLLDCTLSPDLRFGIVSTLADTLDDDAALALVQSSRAALQAEAPQRAADLEEVETRVLKRRMAGLPPESDAKARAAEAILKRDAADPDALAALAWHRFHHRRYAEAESLFGRLLEQKPGDKSAALAMGYARLNSGDVDGALAPLAQAGIADDADTLKLKALVLRRQAGRAYDAGDWDLAADRLERLLGLEPGDQDARELLAWTRHEQQRRPEALDLMEDAFAARPSPGLAGGLLGLYTAEGREEDAYALADRLARDPQPGLRATAGAYFFDRGAPVTAAQLDRDPGRCYANADTPRLEIFGIHRRKEGDSGFSKLAETAFPITLAYPTELGRTWSVTLTPKALDAGSAPDRPRAGRYFRNLNGRPVQQDLVDDLFAVQPDLALELEGRLHLSLHIGTTPLSGPVRPTPTFAARISAPDWYVDLHRCDVRDSILSYVGQEDPYSNDEWGRVTRNGIEAGKTWPLWPGWWVSSSAGFNHYSGEHLWSNQSYHFNAAVGRTLLLDSDELSYGLFFTAEHYRRNSDFFTYGHGGYYSPELMTLLGPFVRYRSAVCRDFWFDVQASVGWLHQQLDSSPAYPLFDGDSGGFTPEAAAEAQTRFDGDTDNKIGASLKLQAMKLLSPYVAAGAFAAVDNSSDHTEWTAGIGVQIFFDTQNLFWTRKDMLRDFGRCTNK